MRPSSSSLAIAAALSLAGTACSSPTDEGPPQVLTGTLDPTFGGLPGRPFAVHVTSSGALLVTRQDDNRVSILGPGDLGPRDSANVGADPGDVLVTGTGTAIVSTFIDGDLHFLNAATGDQTDQTDIGPNAYRLVLSQSGANVFVTTTNGRVYSVDVATGNKVDSVTLSGSLQGIARRDDGRIAVSSSSGRIVILDPATLDIVKERTIAGLVQDIVFSSSGKKLFVALENPAQVQVLDGTTLKAMDTITFNGVLPVTPFGMALSPNGATLLVGSALQGTLAIVNAQSHAVRTVLDLGGVPRRIAFHPNGTRAYVANEAGRLDVIK